MAAKGFDINTETDFFNCTICLERFRKPKYLPCLHTFCQSCLNTYILSSNRDKTTPPTSFSCPLCREKVDPPKQSSPIGEWAELMPLNHMIFSLMDSSRTAKQPNENNCDHCERDGEISKADFRCTECRENLCETCRKYHKRHKLSVNHRVVSISEIKPEDVEVADVEEPCPEHKGEMVKVFCDDHKEMCCVICLATKHKKCDNVKTFDEMAEHMKKNEEVQLFTNTIVEMGTKTESLLIKKKENIDHIEKQHKDILAETSTIVEEAKRKLDNLYGKFKNQISVTQKEHTTKLLDSKERLENFQKFLSYCEKTLMALTKYGSPKQTFVSVEKIKKRLDIQGREMNEFLKDDQDISYNLVVDKHLAALTSSMSSIAEVEVQTTPHDVSLEVITGASSDGTSDLQRQLKSADIRQIEAVKLLNVNTGGWIISGLFLDDGSLMCANLDKKNISVYDISGKLQITHSLDFEPCGLCASPDGGIYISDNNRKEIRVYTLTNNNIKEVKRIKTNDYPNAINMTGGKMLIQLNHSSCISSMTLDGQNQREICKCINYSGIAVSTSSGESRFYYCYEKAVVCRSLDGKEVFRHVLQAIVGPQGVALDAAENVYVCGTDSNNIYLISKDGSSSRVFMSDLTPLTEPYAIGFDKTGTRFFVTDYNNETLAMFKLETVD